MKAATGPYPFPAVALPARHFVALFAGVSLALCVGQGLLLTALVAELRRARRAAERDAGLAHSAQLQSESASRMKDEFLATISHELRTPLNAVLGWLHLIKTGKLDQETERRGFDSIERNVKLQAQLTGDLLDMSKALTGRLRLDVRAVSLVTVLTEAVSQVSSAATAKDVRLNIKTGPGPSVVRGDANRLRQVVWHLLANAIKFTPRGGSIDVTLETNDQACITVRDTGPGIDPEFLPMAFDRFTQADSSPTRVSGGLGVGLSLVRELVERHGGEVKVSNAPGGGAMFLVRLPLIADQRTTVATRRVAGSAPLNGVRVLPTGDDVQGFEASSSARGALVCLAAAWTRRWRCWKAGGPIFSSATRRRRTGMPTRWSARYSRSSRNAAGGFRRWRSPRWRAPTKAHAGCSLM